MRETTYKLNRNAPDEDLFDKQHKRIMHRVKTCIDSGGYVNYVQHPEKDATHALTEITLHWNEQNGL